MAVESPAWHLAAIVEVPFDDCVQCQGKMCGHAVYRQVHIIIWTDGRIECWGQTCYERELGVTSQGRDSKTISGSGSGRILTPEERELLRHNREQLIAKFRKEEEEHARAERERQENLRRAAEGRERQRDASLFRSRTLSPRVNLSADFAPHRAAPIPTSSSPIEQPREREGICKFCGKKTDKWWLYEGKTGMCICYDCRDKA